MPVFDDIYRSLKTQGFSKDLCASLGWTLGELADNTATHAGGVPCYFMLSSTSAPASRKFLTLTIGDIGVGIPAAIRSKEKYKGLKNYEALLSAFKSNVSSWGDEHKRGKGLNDVLAISKGNGAWVRTESNNMGVFFDFRADPYTIRPRSAGTEQDGTRYCMVLIDTKLELVSKREIDGMLDNYLGQL